MRHDAAIRHLLNNPGIRVIESTQTMARQAGHLLSRLKLSSAHAIDAFVVATALAFDAAAIATGDPDDIRRLAAPFRRIGVFAL